MGAGTALSTNGMRVNLARPVVEQFVPAANTVELPELRTRQWRVASPDGLIMCAA
jgi:hypothetical protein